MRLVNATVANKSHDKSALQIWKGRVFPKISLSTPQNLSHNLKYYFLISNFKKNNKETPNHCYNVSLLCFSLLKLFRSNKAKTMQKNVIKFNLGKITSQTLTLISVPTNDFSPTAVFSIPAQSTSDVSTRIWQLCSRKTHLMWHHSQLILRWCLLLNHIALGK